MEWVQWGLWRWEGVWEGRRGEEKKERSSSPPPPFLLERPSSSLSLHTSSPACSRSGSCWSIITDALSFRFRSLTAMSSRDREHPRFDSALVRRSRLTPLLSLSSGYRLTSSGRRFTKYQPNGVHSNVKLFPQSRIEQHSKNNVNKHHLLDPNHNRITIFITSDSPSFKDSAAYRQEVLSVLKPSVSSSFQAASASPPSEEETLRQQQFRERMKELKEKLKELLPDMSFPE